MKRLWLKKARQEKQLSQQDVAIALGMTQSAIYNWEAGKSNPYPRHQKALSSLLGIDVRQHLLGEIAS